MTALTLSKVIGKILIIGPIYDRVDVIDKIKKLIKEYQYVIFNGNICYPFDNIDEIRNRINIVNNILDQNVIYNLGAYDLKLLNILLERREHKDILKWISVKPNVVIVNFESGTSMVIVNGGVTHDIKHPNALLDNIEITFVSKIDNEPWHKQYIGNLGYIVSNNPLDNVPPQFYPYSARIGMRYCEDVPVYAQEADRYGLKKTILL